MHGRVLSYELRGTMTKSRSSSSASRAVQIPALSKAALQDGTYQPGGAYHTTHEARLDHAGARAAWNITGLWGVSLLNSREKLLAELFLDLNQEYNDWHLTSNDPLESPETLAQIQTERIRLAEWERDQLQEQLQLAEWTLTRERDEHRRALTQSLERGLDLEE
jgi:hypothetical protein